MNRGDAVSLIVCLVLYAGLLGSIGLVELRTKRMIQREKSAGRLPVRLVRANARAGMNPFLYVIFGMIWAFLPLVTIALSALVFRTLVPPHARIYLTPLPPLSRVLTTNLQWWLLLAGLALIVYLLIVFGRWFERWSTDPVVWRAREKVKQGDVEGALRDVSEVIETKGPSPSRLEALADCLLKQERWSEAYKVYLDIEKLRPRSGYLYGGKALALWKMGRPEASLEVFEHRVGASPVDLNDICTYCQVLIELGQFDKSWDQIRRAELRFYRLPLSEADNQNHRESIDACRARLAKHFRAKFGGLDEL